MQPNNIDIEKYHPQPIIRRIDCCGIITSKVNLKNRAVKVSPRGMSISTDKLFNTTVKNFASLCGITTNFNNLLVRISPDKQAQIYVDNFPFIANVLLNKKKQSGSIVFEDEIDDIASIKFADSFSDVSPQDNEQVIWVFRHGFNFGLYYDFRPNIKAIDTMKGMKDIYSYVHFLEFYKNLSDKKLTSLIKKGWFPFIALTTAQYSFIAKNLHYIPKLWLKQNFNREYIQSLTEKWMQKKVFQNKKAFIDEGMSSFLKGNYISSISILLPQIEGIIAEKYREENGKELASSSNQIITYIDNLAQISCENYNRLLPCNFKDYLKDFIFKNGMRPKDLELATRHTHSHGRAVAEDYTIERNIQIILTLNQLFYYIIDNTK